MANSVSYKLPLEMLYHWEKVSPNHVYLRQPLPGKGYQDLTYGEVAGQVRRMASALKAKQLPPKSHIGILSKNCAHWIMADYAIWMAGHVSVPLYPNLNQSTVEQILRHSDCKLAFVGKLDDVAAYRKGVPEGVPCIAFPYHEVQAAEKWDDLLKSNPPMTENVTRSMEELATLIYTSGTTGEPKGVMHSFASFAVAGTEILKVIPMYQSDRFFSYLPLAHVAERILVEALSLYGGATVAFAESLDTFQQNLQTIQPTIFLSVPRLYQKFQAGILAKVPQKKLSFLLSLPIISGLIKKKLKAALGLSHARLVITGAAPTPKSVIDWFLKIGIEIQEAYGMTENFAFSHFNRNGEVRIGTVGTQWPRVDTRIAEDGEIQIATACDFLGYYKSASPRSDFFAGEYFKTGDRGEIDSDGYLRITGRTKDLFKTSKGKYIAPSPIESKLSVCEHLEVVCVVGANFAQPFALGMLNPNAKKLKRDQVSADLTALVEKVNATLDPHERICKVVVVKDDWTVESGALTPTMKVKRAFIESKYGGQFETWVKHNDRIAWE